MIMETAFITVQPGQQDAFLGALEAAKLVLARADGFRVIHVHRGIERPTTFMLAIGWDTLEHHTEAFRGGPLFPEWRGLIGPFFAEAPQVEHWDLLEA
jgi:heme-degrading monooxygenase HmoA